MEIILSLILLKAGGDNRVYLILTLDTMLSALLFEVNGERLYITAFYIIVYFIVEKPKVYLSSLQNKENATSGLTPLDSLTFSEIQPVPFEVYSEEKQDALIEDLSFAIRQQEEGKSAYIISLDEDVRADGFIKKEKELEEKLFLKKQAGNISGEEFTARKDIISSSISSLMNLKKEGIKTRRFYLVTSTQDTVLKEEINRVLSSWGSSLKDLSSQEKSRLMTLYSGNKCTKDLRCGLNSLFSDNEKFSLIYIHSYPSSLSNGAGKDFMNIPGTVSFLEFKKENAAFLKRKIDAAYMDLSLSSLKESERIRKEKSAGALRSVLEESSGGDNIHSFSCIIKCPEKEKKRVMKTLLSKGYKASLRPGRNSGILKKFLFGVSSFKEKHLISSSSLSSLFPFSAWAVSDENGMLFGASDGPVFIDFLRRDETHLNSNMIITGKSGSGKSYFAKSLLLKLSMEDTRIFILDPEGEYEKLTKSLKGEVLRVGEENSGVINPFEIRGENGQAAFYSHLQFLEELYSLLFEGMSAPLKEKLNAYTLLLYKNSGITKDTDFSSLSSSSFPTFQDLYCLIEKEDKEDNLLSFLSKAAEGGMNSNILCGHTDISLKEGVTDFSFLNLLSSDNRRLINADLLVILKFLESEVMKGRGKKTKTVIAVDEAHLFADEKFPAALNFMYQMAKRIRKYNGMQIVITQSIKDFALSGEIKRKSEALIGVSQYSLIFSSSAQDVKELTELYKSSGGINQKEQKIISRLKLGEAFFIKSPEKRTVFRVITDKSTEEKFS